MGHVQISRLILAPRAIVFRYITEFRNIPEWLGSDLFQGVKAELPETPPTHLEHAEVRLSLTRFGIKRQFLLRVDAYEPFSKFTYRQVEGFFRSWSHTQTLQEHDARTTLLTDLVDFQMKLGVFGALMDDLLVRRDIEKHLEHRLMLIEDHFRRHAHPRET